MTDYVEVPAAEFDIETLARLYTRTFEGYFYPAIITPELLEAWIRIEDLDLNLSPVLRVGDELAAFATVGLRGRAAYCRGFGVVPEFRGKGLANALCAAMVAQARRANATDMRLGVLIENTGAVNTYLNGGFKPTRELYTVKWERPENFTTDVTKRVRVIDPSAALERYHALHVVPSIWFRDYDSMIKMTGLDAAAILDAGVPSAYVIFRRGGADIEIQDVAAERVQDAIELLRALQMGARQMVCHGEPNDSPMQSAFQASGFAIMHRRYEMIAEV